MSKTIAVVLCNLGGPDSLEAVEPFLFNLFNDKAIITLPRPLRFLLAKFISRKRAPLAKDIYRLIGGKSPIVEQTQAQANALENLLNNGTKNRYKVFIAMRYWHPFAEEVVRKVEKSGAEEVILLPLYPQFSTTTSESSFEEWSRQAKRLGVTIPVSKICCYYQQKEFITAHAKLIQPYWDKAKKDYTKVRILFSAHGLPKKVITAGDPYQYQVEQTAKAVAGTLKLTPDDWTVCYQSKVGRLEWIGPSTEQELERAANEHVAVVVVPIAFVSEHSETLVELDIEYKHKAEQWKIPGYVRVPALGVQSEFIQGLATMCLTLPQEASICSYQGKRCCPDQFSRCLG